MDSEPPDIWKRFDTNVVTHSAAHHIVAIATLLERNGYARVSDVARTLNITRGSASLTLKTLREKGLVEEDENRFLRLSDRGEAIATAVVGKKRLIHKFFCDVLGVPEEAAEVDTCKIEHLVGPRTSRQLARFLHFVESDDPRAKEFLGAWVKCKASRAGGPDSQPAYDPDGVSEMRAEEKQQPDA
ncbi:MAG: metal-dependent transcriptional regulator [Phycisphaerales bacterium]|nr:MAG: metal-dependent transcriptional regulator [Phycisphaerales bacterium]